MQGTYHLIVRKPYSEIPQEFVQWLSDNSSKYLWCQHDADEDIENTHVHVSFTDFKLTDKALEKKREKLNLNGSVTRLLSYVHGTRQRYDETKLAVYIIKGDVNHVVKGNYDNIDELSSQWVDKEDVKKVDDKKKPYDEYEVLKKDFNKYYEEINRPHITLDSIRSWTMRWYWKRDGRMPPAIAYKRNAASLYVHATELCGGSIDCAFEELKQLWY